MNRSPLCAIPSIHSFLDGMAQRFNSALSSSPATWEESADIGIRILWRFWESREGTKRFRSRGVAAAADS